MNNEFIEIENKYSNVKLGIIDRFKVWKARRDAQKDREWSDKIEGEISEVDYSDADKLQSELLERKRIKKATRDAQRLFRYYNNKEKYDHDVWDGLGEKEFIEEYLLEHGVIQKTLPEAKVPNKHEFINKYPTKKSEEELSYERSMIKPKIFYRMGEKEYELPETFLKFAGNYNNNTDDIRKMIPFEEKENEQYYITDTILQQKMPTIERQKILYRMAEFSLFELRGGYEFEEPELMQMSLSEEDININRKVMKLVRDLSYLKVILEKDSESGEKILNVYLGKILDLRKNVMEKQQSEAKMER